MHISKTETIPVRTAGEVVGVRHAVRRWAVELGFSLVEQTKMVTAASELARNALEHGGGGRVRMQALNNETRRGVKLTFSDEGPGIANLEQALKDGFSTGSGMGLGLSGAKRLANEFEIESAPGQGTKVTITRWRNS